MKNKIFLILILIATLIALGGIIALMLSYVETGYLFLSFGLSIVNLLGFIMLVRNSSLTKTTYFRFISIFIAIVIVGAMFKIMHWPGSAIMLTIGLMGIPSIYTFRFINKSVKRQLDIMKLIWVLTTYITALGVIMHWLPRDISYLPNVIMLATTIHFAMTCMKDKELMES